MGRRGRDRILSVRKHTYSQGGGWSQPQGSFLRSEGSEPHTGLPSPRILPLKASPQKVELWKPAELVLESQTYTGHRGFSFTECTQNLTCCQYQQETVAWKVPGSDPLGDPGKPPREAGGNWEGPGDWQAGSSHFRDLGILLKLPKKIFHRKEHLQIISMRTASV